MGENVCVLTYFKILWDPVKVQISQIPERDVTCKTELVMERGGEKSQENDQLNSEHKTHGFYSDTMFLWSPEQSWWKVEWDPYRTFNNIGPTPGTWWRISSLRSQHHFLGHSYYIENVEPI